MNAATYGALDEPHPAEPMARPPMPSIAAAALLESRLLVEAVLRSVSDRLGRLAERAPTLG